MELERGTCLYRAEAMRSLAPVRTILLVYGPLLTLTRRYEDHFDPLTARRRASGSVVGTDNAGPVNNGFPADNPRLSARNPRKASGIYRASSPPPKTCLLPTLLLPKSASSNLNQAPPVRDNHLFVWSVRIIKC